MKSKIYLIFTLSILAIPALNFGMSKVITGAATTSGTSYSAGSTNVNGAQHMALAKYSNNTLDKTF